MTEIWKDINGFEGIYRISNQGKNVKAFDDDGNFIMGFCSMAVAEKITGINQGDISRCTLGKTEHAGGYVWKIVKHGGIRKDVE